MARHEPYAAFRLPDFRYLLGALFIVSMAFKMQQVAVGWDIYERTGSVIALRSHSLRTALLQRSFKPPEQEFALPDLGPHAVEGACLTEG